MTFRLIRPSRHAAARPSRSPLLKISQHAVARIARNGHGSTLRIAHQIPEPTSTLAGISDPAALAAVCDPTEIVAPPSGFSLPRDTPPAVTAAIMWAFAQLGTPYSFGGDCTAAHSGDPAQQCDCSSLVILSPTILRGCDLLVCVEDGVVDAVVVGVFADQRSSGSSPRRDAVRFGVTGRGRGDALAPGATR